MGLKQMQACNINEKIYSEGLNWSEFCYRGPSSGKVYRHSTEERRSQWLGTNVVIRCKWGQRPNISSWVVVRLDLSNGVLAWWHVVKKMTIFLDKVQKKVSEVWRIKKNRPESDFMPNKPAVFKGREQRTRDHVLFMFQIYTDGSNTGYETL